MHFFNPAQVMQLVEVVSTVATAADVAETVRALCPAIGKHPVSCGDRAGFIVNALLFPYLNDAVRMLEAHYADADEIDTAMKEGCALPMGPFELLDVVGNDVSLAIQRTLFLEFREPGFAPAPLLEHLVTAGYLGRKTGRGFRDYTTPLTMAEPSAHPPQLGPARAPRGHHARRRPTGSTWSGSWPCPETGDPVATMVCLHPLPTHGGMMDSQIFRKAAARLPALAQIAVLRFNTRGTSSAQGTSEGAFDDARGERYDVAAAIEYAEFADLPAIWVVGWSFGTDLALKYANDPGVVGAILLSPPLRYSTDEDLAAGARPASRWWRSCRSSTTTCARPRRASGSPPSRRPR